MIQKALVSITGEKKVQFENAIRLHLSDLRNSRKGMFILPKITEMLDDSGDI